MTQPVPPLVAAAEDRARAAGFPMSSEPAVGRLLAVLAAHLPEGARVLELGTGAGVGAAWLVSGLLPRDDVRVITVECDPATAALAAAGIWPAFVELRVGDGLASLTRDPGFDLIFADAQGGKWEGLERTIAAVRPGGLLVVDDMTPAADWSEEQRTKQAEVRRVLLTHPLLRSAEIEHGSGMILCARVARQGAG